MKYESTGQIFDRDLLSPRAKEMCKDSKVVWMTEKRGKKKIIEKMIFCGFYRCVNPSDLLTN